MKFSSLLCFFISSLAPTRYTHSSPPFPCHTASLRLRCRCLRIPLHPQPQQIQTNVSRRQTVSTRDRVSVPVLAGHGVSDDVAGLVGDIGDVVV